MSLSRALVLTFAFAVLAGSACAKELNATIPAALVDPASNAGSQTIVLAGGCFWGIQGVYQHVKGVTQVLAGYAGGAKATATYDQVTTETTGHAESVQITYDPKVISLGHLLQIYFSVAHDPTELNRQGNDEGPSYRSAIFFADAGQQSVARAYIDQLNKAHIFDKPIATALEPLKGFYMAEGYHQNFLIEAQVHHQDTQLYAQSWNYLVYNDIPKIAALRKVYPQMYRDDPVRVPKTLLH